MFLKIQILLLFIFSVFFQSCKQVETLSPSKDFYLSIVKPKNSDKIEINVIAGNSSLISSKGDNFIFKVSLSQVRGGHSDVLGTKFNIHDGLDAKRIRIIRNGIITSVLSYNELTLLNKEKSDSILAFKVILK